MSIVTYRRFTAYASVALCCAGCVANPAQSRAEWDAPPTHVLNAEWEVTLNPEISSRDTITGVVVGNGVLGFSQASGDSRLIALSQLPQDSLRGAFRRWSPLERASAASPTLAPQPIGTINASWVLVAGPERSVVEAHNMSIASLPIVLREPLDAQPAVCQTGEARFEVFPRDAGRRARRLVVRGDLAHPYLAAEPSEITARVVSPEAIARGDGRGLCALVGPDSATVITSTSPQGTRIALRGRPCEHHTPVYLLGWQLTSRSHATPCDAAAAVGRLFVLQRSASSTSRVRGGRLLDAYDAQGEYLARLRLPFAVQHIASGYGRVYTLRPYGEQFRLASFVLPMKLRDETTVSDIARLRLDGLVDSASNREKQ